MFVCVFFSSSSSSPYWMTAIIMPLTFSFWILDGWMMMMMKFIIYFHVGYKNDGIVIGISHEILIDPRYYIPLFQFFRLVVFPLCPRRKIHKGPKFSFHLFSSLWILSSHTHTDGPSNVCVSFSRWKAETRWRWVSSCVPFLSALVALPSFSPHRRLCPAKPRESIFTRRPTDRPTALYFKKGQKKCWTKSNRLVDGLHVSFSSRSS
jgi:hypothetical protein